MTAPESPSSPEHRRVSARPPPAGCRRRVHGLRRGAARRTDGAAGRERHPPRARRRHRRRLPHRVRIAGHRRDRASGRPGQQRRLWLPGRDRGHPAGRSQAAIRREPLRGGPAHPAGGATHACPAQRPHHQCVLDRGQIHHAVERLVPRHQVRGGGPQRRAAARTRPARHRRRRHGTRRHQHGVACGRRGAICSPRRHRAPMPARRPSVAKMLSGAGLASTPEGTGKAIARAATVRRPRTRYAVGLGAKPIILLAACCPTGCSTGWCGSPSASPTASSGRHTPTRSRGDGRHDAAPTHRCTSSRTPAGRRTSMSPSPRRSRPTMKRIAVQYPGPQNGLGQTAIPTIASLADNAHRLLMSAHGRRSDRVLRPQHGCAGGVRSGPAVRIGRQADRGALRIGVRGAVTHARGILSRPLRRRTGRVPGRAERHRPESP